MAGSDNYSFDYRGKSVLVTGGGAGIGQACVKAFADCGADLAIAENDPERCRELEKSHPDALVVECDVTSDAGCGQAGRGAWLAVRQA